MIRYLLFLPLLLPGAARAQSRRGACQPDSVRPAGPLAQYRPAARLALALGPPAALVGYGLLIRRQTVGPFDSRYFLREEIQEAVGGFRTRADDYTRYVPTVAVFGLSLVGQPARHSMVERIMLFNAANLLSSGIVSTLKRVVRESRPLDPALQTSFPSYHTAQAFTGATVLAEEYGGASAWYSVSGYGVATATGALRVVNDHHWVSDVAVGAAIGILSTEAVYAVYPLVRRALNRGDRARETRVLLVPAAPAGSRAGAALTWLLR